jgi:hypothetical protein
MLVLCWPGKRLHHSPVVFCRCNPGWVPLPPPRRCLLCCPRAVFHRTCFHCDLTPGTDHPVGRSPLPAPLPGMCRHCPVSCGGDRHYHTALQ